MAKQLFKNNAGSLVVGSVAVGATTLSLTPGTGARFDAPAAGEFFLGTLFEKDDDGNELRFEVVKVTGRAGDTLTVARDFESMTGNSGGYAYPSAAGRQVFFDCRWTAYAAGNTLQAAGNLSDVQDAEAARENLGLGNVDNTRDADKPVSTAQAAAFETVLELAATDATDKANARQAVLVSGENIKTLNGNSLLGAGDLTVTAPTMTATSGGSVPTPPNDPNKFLNGEGVFATPPGGGGATWGDVGGTLADQLDLSLALNSKEPAITAGSAQQYIKGDKTLGTMPTSLPASDVPAWAKAVTKPSYTAADVGLGAVDNTSDMNKPVSTAQAEADAAVLVAAATDASNKANARQAPLVSGTNIKTLNGNSLLGEGDIAVGDVTLDGVQTLTNKTLVSVVLTGGVTEDDFQITDGPSVDLNPANGAIQTWTLGASRTATAMNFASGQSMILGIDDGAAYSLTFPAITWTKQGGRGTAPALNATVKTWVVLWKVGTTLYGSYLGDA